MKTNDASEFIKSLRVGYIPANNNLGRLGLKTKIIGGTDKFKMSDMMLSIGANTFQGTIGADFSQGIPYWVANMKINRFETNRFIPKDDDAFRVFSDGNLNISDKLLRIETCCYSKSLIFENKEDEDAFLASEKGKEVLDADFLEKLSSAEELNVNTEDVEY